MNKNLFFLKLFAILFSYLIISSNINAQFPGWRGSMNVVTNNSGTTMTNYQVPVILNTQTLISMGLMQTNGNDIRFGQDCIGSSLYDHWTEGYLNTDSTKLWVKVPSVPGNNSVTNIYVFREYIGIIFKHAGNVYRS